MKNQPARSAPGTPVRPPTGVLAVARRPVIPLCTSRLLATTLVERPETNWAVIWGPFWEKPWWWGFLRGGHVAAVGFWAWPGRRHRGWRMSGWLARVARLGGGRRACGEWCFGSQAGHLRDAVCRRVRGDSAVARWAGAWPRNGTVFDRMHTPLTVWFHACWLFPRPRTGSLLSTFSARWRSARMRRRGGCCTGCGRCWSAPAGQAAGSVEVDERFIGGEEAGLRGGRQRGKKVLTGIAVEVREPKGIGRCRMAVLADGSA